MNYRAHSTQKVEDRKLSDGPKHLLSVRADKGVHCKLHCGPRWERLQKENQNPKTFKVLEKNTRKLAHTLVIHMLFRDI